MLFVSLNLGLYATYLKLPPQQDGWLNWIANQAFAEVRWLKGATVISKQNNSFVVDPLGKAPIPWAAIAGKAGLLALFIFKQNFFVGSCPVRSILFYDGDIGTCFNFKVGYFLHKVQP